MGSYVRILPFGDEGDGSVNSVNGQTGTVILDATDVGADPAGTAQALFDVLGGKYVRSTRFEIISSGTSGTVTLPGNSQVVLDDFGGTVDAVVTKVQGGKPTTDSAKTSGNVVVATTFDSSGNYVLSGTPNAYPISIVYRVRQTLEDFDSAASNIWGPSTIEQVTSDDLALYVPYTGATENLNLDTFALQTSTIKDTSGLDAIKTSSRQLLRPDGLVAFEWSANDLPTFKSNSNVAGFYFEGGSVPYIQYDSISDALSTGNAARFVFNTSYVQLGLIEDTSLNTAIDISGRVLIDNSGIKAADFSTSQRQLFDFGGSYPSIDYGNYWLMNIGITNSVPLLDWSTTAGGSVKIYQGTYMNVVGDFTNLQLNDTSGNATIDWGLRTLKDNTGNDSVDWDYHLLKYIGSTTVDWQNKYLVHDGGGGPVNSIEWGNFKANNSGGFTSLDYGNHHLYDITGTGSIKSMDYNLRQLYATDGTTVVLDFSVQQPSSGAVTAGATYTATEQTMIQEMYDALRAYGLLS